MSASTCVAAAALVLLSAQNPAVAQSFSAETLLHEERFPDPGTLVSARKDEFITGFEVSVVDVQVLKTPAVAAASGRTVAVAGALLHAVEVEDLGRIYCGRSGSDGKPALEAIGASACLRDADADGAFDHYFSQYRVRREEPLTVDAVMSPERLKTPAEYRSAAPGQIWSSRLELYHAGHALNDWQGGKAPVIGFRFERRNADGSTETYTRQPWLGDANPARMERTVVEVGACIRILNTGDEFNSADGDDKPLNVLIEQPGSFFGSTCKKRHAAAPPTTQQ